MPDHSLTGPYRALAQQVREKRESSMEQEHLRYKLDVLRAASAEIKTLAARLIEIPGCHHAWARLVDAADIIDQQVAQLTKEQGAGDE